MKNNQPWKTLLILSGGLIVFYFIFKALLLLYISFFILLIAFLSDSLSSKIAWAWLKFAEILGWINNRLVLSLIFFLILTPISWLYRFFGKSNLSLKKKETNSYYVSRDHEFKNEDMENIW